VFIKNISPFAMPLIAQTSLVAEFTSKISEKEFNQEKLRKELLEGLTAEQMYISSKFFYDSNGSSLFEWITQLPEYYPTRTEKYIIKKYSRELFGHLSHIDLVELGSGDCSKISLVLRSIDKKHLHTIIYRPIDFSSSSLNTSKKILNTSFPDLKIKSKKADFTQLHELPNGQPRIICFFGSTIGNFEPEQTEILLNRLSKIMNSGDQLIMGLDLIKDINVLEAAYNDSQRITEAFNKNILRACNNTLGTNFLTPDFKHVAYFNQTKNRIEMHLRALNDVFIKSHYFNGRIIIKKGETIHTENSHKYDRESISEMANLSGLTIKNIYNDPCNWFALVQLTK